MFTYKWFLQIFFPSHRLDLSTATTKAAQDAGGKEIAFDLRKGPPAGYTAKWGLSRNVRHSVRVKLMLRSCTRFQTESSHTTN